MIFKPEATIYSYEVEREAGQRVLYFNYLGAPYVPSLAESREVMSRTVDALIESPNISRIVFVQQRNYNHDFQQTSLLLEIAQLYTYLMKHEKVLSPARLVLNYQNILADTYAIMNYLVMLLKQDPIACYHEIKRILREEKVAAERIQREYKEGQLNFNRLLEKFLSLMEQTRIIKEAMQFLVGYRLYDRQIYEHFFRPDVIPNFTFTRLVASLPENGEIISQYEIGSGYDRSLVTILRKEDEAKFIYHLMPPEYALSEEHHMLLNLARNVLIEHRPKAEEFTDPERTRQVFMNVSVNSY